MRRGDALADAAAERRGALAVEVALEAVADRLVQQDAGPTGAEHHRHRTGGRGHGGEVDERLPRRLAAEFERPVVGDELAQRMPAAHAGEAGLAAAVLLGDHRDVEAHQRAHIGGQRALAVGDEHHLVGHRDRGHHLHDARIDAPRLAVDALEPTHLLVVAQRADRVDRGIERVPRAAAQHRGAALAAAGGDGACGARGVEQRLGEDLVGVGEAGLLAGERAHADALLDARAAFLDDAVLERPALVARELEVEVGGVDAARERRAERALELRQVEPRRSQDQLLGECERVGGRCGGCGSGRRGGHVAAYPTAITAPGARAPGRPHAPRAAPRGRKPR